MIRLAVFGLSERLIEDVARRVHRAHVMRISEQPRDLPQYSLTNFDAVAFLGQLSPEAADVERMIGRGKHILLATDSILSAEGIQDLVDLGAKAGVRVIVMNPDRLLPSRQLIYDELRSEKFGAPGLIRLHRWQPASPRTLGSQLPAPLVRDLDLVLWLLNQAPNVVLGVEQFHPDMRPNGAIHVHLGFSDGGMALVDYVDCLPSGDGYQSLSVIGSKGALYSDDQSNCQLNFGGGTPRAHLADEGILSLAGSIQQFVDGLSADSVPPAAQLLWREVKDLGWNVRRSIETRNAVVPEVL